VDESGSLQEIVCCIGHPVAGNPSQFILERAFAALGLEWRYLTLDVTPEQLADAVRGMRAMGFRGSSIQLPHRVAVVPLVDRLGEAAEMTGSVSCIVREGDEFVGENTDGPAFLAALRESLDPAGKKFVVLGAGGLARAAAFAAAQAGAAEITIVSRTESHGRALAESLVQRLQISASYSAWEGDFAVPEGIDVLVNATSVGRADATARVPLDVDSLQQSMLVADLVVNPPQTRLLRDAAHRGCRTMHGLGMFVNQCTANFKLWSGLDADPAVMREALEEYLEF
jgi:shikimate dehydrogenase